MNEASLTQLRIIVERAVRPVRASTPRKRGMREELLSHVREAFEEESAKLGDDRAALERTALRFGDPAEVTSQLQESVPLGDGIRRFWEGRPGESALRAGFRLAGVTGALAASSLVVALFTVGWVGAWPREAVITCICGVLALPVYLFGLAFLTDRMERALDGPAGRSRLQVALVAVGSWLFMLLLAVALTWPTWPAEWDYLSVGLIAGWLGVTTSVFPYALAQSSIARRRYHEDWASLDIA
jgi:hypothetical protein